MGGKGTGVRGTGVRKVGGGGSTGAGGGKYTFKTSGGQSIDRSDLRGKPGKTKTGEVTQKLKGGKTITFKPREGSKFIAWKGNI